MDLGSPPLCMECKQYLHQFTGREINKEKVRATCLQSLADLKYVIVLLVNPLDGAAHLDS